MTKEEEKIVEEITSGYYKENWDKIIMKFIKFANPHIANSEALTSLKIDPNQHIYFHAAWLKPGRNTYIVERLFMGNDKASFQ